MSSPQPQLKQQPYTPVQSPLPPPLQQQQQLQQHSHADLLTTSHGSAQSTDSSSLNLVSALTAAIHANSKTGTSSGAGGGGGIAGSIRSETVKAGSGQQQQMRNESLNGPANSSAIDPHLHEPGLSESSTSDIAQMKFKSELLSKFPGNYFWRIFILKSVKVPKNLAKFHFIFC